MKGPYILRKTKTELANNTTEFWLFLIVIKKKERLLFSKKGLLFQILKIILKLSHDIIHVIIIHYKKQVSHQYFPR